MVTPYVGRADLAALIIEEHSSEVLSLAAESSAALSSFHRVNVGSNVLRYNLLETLPTAQWLGGTDPDIEKKPATEMSWGSATVQVEEAATIVIVPENVLDDSSIDLWGEIRNRAAEAVGRLIDMTVFFGTAPVGGVPASFPVGGIVGRAIAAGNTLPGTANAADDWNQLLGLVEEDGYNPDRAFAGPGLRSSLRGAVDGDGRPLFTASFQQEAPTAPYGVPITYVARGAWDTTKAQAVVGDPSLAWIVMRQDLTAKTLDQATVGDINLAEQDALALRIKIRMGFCVVAPKGIDSPANPYPFAVLAPVPTGP